MDVRPSASDGQGTCSPSTIIHYHVREFIHVQPFASTQLGGVFWLSDFLNVKRFTASLTLCMCSEPMFH